jgi:exodeoxyribonuclease V alpha subunit
LKQNSAAVLDGKIRPTANGAPGVLRPWYVVDQLSDATSVRECLRELFEAKLGGRLGLDLMRDVQVLTPMHKGPLGTVELNALIQHVLQKKLYGVRLPEPERGRRAQIRLGDKVIQSRNDYELDVMNGSVGFVTDVRPNGGFIVEFDGREVEVGEEGTRDLELAYVTTVHKVQGSEFPCAIVIAHRSQAFMHDRNLLYTAVTRAQKAAIILGDAWGIRNCADMVHACNRNTFLSIMLAGASSEDPAGGVQ